MIGLYICIGDQRSKRFEIAKERVTIGSDASNDLVLRDGGVEPYHGALVRVRDRWFLSSRRHSETASERLRALEDGARVQVGDYTVVLAAAPAPLQARVAGTPAEPMPVAQDPDAQEQELATQELATQELDEHQRVTARRPAVAPPTLLPPRSMLPPPAMMPPPMMMPPVLPPPWVQEQLAAEPEPEPAEPAYDPTEQSLIDAIVRGDEDSRLVYADWLEGHGDALRAEFLRIQHRLAAMGPATHRDYYDQLGSGLRRMQELSLRVDFHWRRQIGRPAVEGCRQVVADVQCKMDWGKLEPTDRPDVRRCNGCGDDVYYVTTMSAAREYVRRGHCISVDFSQARAPHDLRADPLLMPRSPMMHNPSPYPAGGWPGAMEPPPGPED